MDYSELLTASKYLFHFESVYVIITLLIFDPLFFVSLLCFVLLFIVNINLHILSIPVSSFGTSKIYSLLFELFCYLFSCLHEKLPLLIFILRFRGLLSIPICFSISFMDTFYGYFVYLFICFIDGDLRWWCVLETCV